jgi:protein-L-isoaspartate(D-aspartate) O-methyltransferase
VTTDIAGEASAGHLRSEMVDLLIADGRVRTTAVADALRTVPRHLFVPQASPEAAYANSAVTIKQDTGGTSLSCASQPGVVAQMLEQLQPRPGDKILEIGAGTGYNAALLAHLVGPRGHVTTIDVDDDLVLGARSRLADAGVRNATVVLGDGALGHPGSAPFDRITATVGAHGIPPAWTGQLAPAGRLLVSQRLRGSVCRSIAYEHQAGSWHSVSSAMNTFMPLRGGIAGDERRMIPLAPDGRALLQTNGEQAPDPGALAGVLSQPRTTSWSGVLFRAMESAEWMELWLTCTLPNGLNQLPASKEAIDTGLLTEPYRSSCATFDQGALSYLTRRLSARRTPEGGKLWEFGAVGHGPKSGELAAQVTDSMRAWDRDYRCHEAGFELRPLETAPDEPRPGRFRVDTPFQQLIISWP